MAVASAPHYLAWSSADLAPNTTFQITYGDYGCLTSIDEDGHVTGTPSFVTGLTLFGCVPVDDVHAVGNMDPIYPQLFSFVGESCTIKHVMTGNCLSFYPPQNQTSQDDSSDSDDSDSSGLLLPALVPCDSSYTLATFNSTYFIPLPVQRGQISAGDFDLTYDDVFGLGFVDAIEDYWILNFTTTPLPDISTKVTSLIPTEPSFSIHFESENRTQLWCLSSEDQGNVTVAACKSTDAQRFSVQGYDADGRLLIKHTASHKCLHSPASQDGELANLAILDLTDCESAVAANETISYKIGTAYASTLQWGGSYFVDSFCLAGDGIDPLVLNFTALQFIDCDFGIPSMTWVLTGI